MIHPIKTFNYNKAITFKNSTPAQAQVSTKTSTPAVSSQPAKPPQPTTPTLPVNKKNDQISQTIGNCVSIGILLCAGTYFIKNFPKVKKNFPIETDKCLTRCLFDSLKENKNIPTLSTCKSINPKLKDFLETQVLLAKATKEELEKSGNPSFTNRLLMCGEPGSGKSFFAKIFAKTLDADYMEIKYSDINKRYCGEHIENLKNIFENIIETAKKSPDKKFVVNFNEIDSLAKPIEKLQTSSYGSFKTDERAVFLTYIENLGEVVPNVTVIGSTNILPKNGGFDGALMSRFQGCIEIENPDKNCLFEALKAHLLTLPEGKNFVDKYSEKLEQYSEELVKRKASFRNLNKIIEDSKRFYLTDLVNKKSNEFKFDYLEKAKNTLGATDGEIALANRRID